MSFVWLQASCLQEEETTSRVENLQNLEKSHKQELQRLKNENDNFQNKYVHNLFWFYAYRDIGKQMHSDGGIQCPLQNVSEVYSLYRGPLLLWL